MMIVQKQRNLREIERKKIPDVSNVDVDVFFSTILKSNASSSGKKMVTNTHTHTNFQSASHGQQKNLLKKKIKKLFSAQLFKNNDDDDDYNG